MTQFGCPVGFDVLLRHGQSVWGNPQYSPSWRVQRLRQVLDGLFLECHPDPSTPKATLRPFMNLRCRRTAYSSKQIADLRQNWESSRLAADCEEERFFVRSKALLFESRETEMCQS